MKSKNLNNYSHPHEYFKFLSVFLSIIKTFVFFVNFQFIKFIRGKIEFYLSHINLIKILRKCLKN